MKPADQAFQREISPLSGLANGLAGPIDLPLQPEELLFNLEILFDPLCQPWSQYMDFDRKSRGWVQLPFRSQEAFEAIAYGYYRRAKNDKAFCPIFPEIPGPRLNYL